MNNRPFGGRSTETYSRPIGMICSVYSTSRQCTENSPLARRIIHSCVMMTVIMLVSVKRPETIGHCLVQCVLRKQAGVRKLGDVPLPVQYFKLRENVLFLLASLLTSSTVAINTT
jgi:hypothetical protein